ncbi:hypothetical protein MnTg02_01106 [bacterium MnTg02]|nr:hypothetical protein MnTg02_01106 [bacterium MnTg02]
MLAPSPVDFTSELIKSRVQTVAPANLQGELEAHPGIEIGQCRSKLHSALAGEFANMESEFLRQNTERLVPRNTRLFQNWHQMRERQRRESGRQSGAQFQRHILKGHETNRAGLPVFAKGTARQEMQSRGWRIAFPFGPNNHAILTGRHYLGNVLRRGLKKPYPGRFIDRELPAKKFGLDGQAMGQGAEFTIQSGFHAARQTGLFCAQIARQPNGDGFCPCLSQSQTIVDNQKSPDHPATAYDQQRCEDEGQGTRNGRTCDDQIGQHGLSTVRRWKICQSD